MLYISFNVFIAMQLNGSRELGLICACSIVMERTITNYFMPINSTFSTRTGEIPQFTSDGGNLLFSVILFTFLGGGACIL